MSIAKCPDCGRLVSLRFPVHTCTEAPMTKTPKAKKPTRGDYVRVHMGDAKPPFEGRVQIGTKGCLLVIRQETRLSDEGQRKPVHERSITDLEQTTRQLLAPAALVTVVDRATLGEDAQMTGFLPEAYARRTAARMAAGKPIGD